ncbi:MAG: hypothetical protein COX79_02575 [Candidatus Levybacteria bacterium CG_4_10_14_0_2_um_filter_36_16]|nr:MAG: hypothetical protein AUK12_04935 [Candidatus Levybacteria bacterium CG2_30_37_29]PIR79226.1 MAG: hypothetical protein COU26_02255 [Candidatus Levybacteria bacterium CG10_big_fil_rev_8_21_14_0_10_36_30]PIZ97365.1 MAG: hypothetical protein COX79_02575 [Candidatus Levybacteria bacterium CG_4_10_14_0_2_um_filter_36_16]PJA90890.1 MAG: hypothetical protein CO136_00175 [Candidatus Levybacteria bacterium CG_4_9_14_3_um_filter_36_7]
MLTSEAKILYHIDIIISEYLSFLANILSAIPLRIVDYVVIFTGIFFIFEEASLGFVSSFSQLIATIGAFFISLFAYSFVSGILISKLSLPKGFSDAIAFLSLAVLIYVIITTLAFVINKKIGKIHLLPKVNIIGGIICGSLSYFFISACIIAILLSFPVSQVVKDSISNSLIGGFLVSRTQTIERSIKVVFGGAIDETINFLTIKPGSSDTVSLNFKTKNFKIDVFSENKMLEMLNEFRTKNGLESLSKDDTLTNAATVHAKDMLINGYFSHYSLEGYSPFDRLEALRIQYSSAGENLAFAPDVQIAMDGLEKSPGHRENMLSSKFKKIGIAVLDAGMFGKIFVQEFTD